MSTTFFGMTLTEIFEIPQIQSLLLKFWFLGLTNQSAVVEQQQQYFRIIKKSVNFANCFSFEMPINMYHSLIQKIAAALSVLNCSKILNTIVNYMKINKLSFISFEIFGLHFMQLFGKILETLNEKMQPYQKDDPSPTYYVIPNSPNVEYRMSKIIRDAFVAMTYTDKLGKVNLKDTKSIQPAPLLELKELKPKNNNGSTDNPLGLSTISDHLNPHIHNYMIPPRSSDRPRSNTTFPKLDTLQGRLVLQSTLNKQSRHDRSDGGIYPVGEKMRNKPKANLSSFMVGGFEIVDYSDSINQLHKKLLSKILLNK